MKRKLRFHVLGIPCTKTNLDYVGCAFTQKVYKFCKMMHDRGHYVMHYGVEGSNPECDENIIVVPDKIYSKYYSLENFKTTLGSNVDMENECYQTFYKNTIAEIQKRKQPNDIILPFWGWAVKPVCDAFPDLISIEPGVGYGSGTWAKYRIFDSYSTYSAYCGLDGVNGNLSWYDAVIPNFFDLNDFEYNPNKRTSCKDPYFLYLGRVCDCKGVDIAIQVCEKLGVKLKVAGQPDDFYKNYAWPKNIEFLGYADIKTRKDLMKNAVASFLPSKYMEPFGCVQVENLLCGTPTITTDWGGFAENNIDGLTGYRCKTFNDFVVAAKKCLNNEIKPIDCRSFGEKYSLENIAPKFEKYFNDILNLYTNEGWYHIDEDD